MTDLLQELMNDVRADRMDTLWHKYGKWVIYTAISIVLVTGVVVYVNHHRRDTAMKQTALYFQAASALNKGEAREALMALDKIEVPEKSTYYGLVLLKKAQANMMLDKKEEAEKLLAVLSKRDDMYGDVGKIVQGEGATPDAKKTTALQYSRLEWAAWETAAEGDNIKAAQQFDALVHMENVPASMHDRAGMMANYFKFKSDNGKAGNDKASDGNE